MKSINVGELVHEVTVQAGTEGVDGSGAPETTWADLGTVRAGRRHWTSNETFRGEQLSAAMFTVWTMRYWSEMDPDLVDIQKSRRLVYQGRIYDIVEVAPMDPRVGLEVRTLASSRLEADA
jgi:SPP1 family predicted phage head-tail adaptor